MTDLLEKVLAAFWLVSSILFFATNGYLSFKLRKKKKDMIIAIAESAPKKVRGRMLLSMMSNMSWIFASSSSYIWFTYLMLRFLWNIPHREIIEWQKEIKKIIGKSYKVYWFSAMAGNVMSFGAIVLLIYVGVWR